MTATADGWVFDLTAPEKSDVPKPQPLDDRMLPVLSDPAKWRNYSNDILYEGEKALRHLIAKLGENSTWHNQARRRRYTFSMLFEMMFGRPYDQKKDARMVVPLTRVMAYYSSRIQKTGYVNGKWRDKTSYTISPKRLKRPPYSLRLRMEWLAEQGLVPNGKNMQLPKDNLRPGHARNKRTDANMQRRSEEAKRRYNERYKDREH